MAKEEEKMEKNYTILPSKVDVIVDAITKLVEFNSDHLTNRDVNQRRILRCSQRWKNS